MTPSMLEEMAKGLALAVLVNPISWPCGEFSNCWKIPKHTHVKAHSGDPLNEAVDVLATAARTGVIQCSKQLSHQIQQVAKHHDALQWMWLVHKAMSKDVRCPSLSEDQQSMLVPCLSFHSQTPHCMLSNRCCINHSSLELVGGSGRGACFLLAFWKKAGLSVATLVAMRRLTLGWSSRE